MMSAIVDTHLHYWPPQTPDVTYDSGGMELGPPISVEDVIELADSAGVSGIVQVTPSLMGYDNRYSLEGALRYPDRIRVLGRFDPDAPDVTAQLRAWAQHRVSAGVRLTLFPGGSHPVDWVRAWEGFWKTCQDLGLIVAVFAPDQAARLAELARRQPNLVLLVDHCALDHKPAAPDEWDLVLALQKFSNVYLKVSLFPQVSAQPYPFSDAAELMRQVYDRFGADRLIWGSNFPPVLERCSYQQSIDFIRKECGFITTEDVEMILGGTATRLLSTVPSAQRMLSRPVEHELSTSQRP